VLVAHHVETLLHRFAEPFTRFEAELQQAMQLFVANLRLVQFLVNAFEAGSHFRLKSANLRVESANFCIESADSRIEFANFRRESAKLRVDSA
jgi:hypothetical protein